MRLSRSEGMRKVIVIGDQMVAAASPSVRDRMFAAFVRAAQWMFWDSAYRLERWPV